VTYQRIIYLPTDKIEAAPWNPPRRTNSKVMASLVRSMRENGFWWYMPLIIGRGDVLADGHRRLAAACELRIVSVPVLRVDKAADVLWSEINGRRRTVSAAESLEAHVRGLQAIPDQHSRPVQEIVNVVGLDELRKDYMIGVSPSILTWAKTIGRYIGQTDARMIAQITMWLRKHEMQRRVRAAMDGGIEPGLLMGHVLNDTPLPRPTWATG